ncbi:cytochrome c biogenesis protein ResB [Tomitella biformata]|uniref:cytochrome c biogenesis protein ResB n=1 Tax=Tomitella biformata TaxID=630403 RepID=UPI0004675B95|nr:cytochrome c biogenesis protein ResB [Tomitella biformata]
MSTPTWQSLPRKLAATCRNLWRSLTSMRTALVLLFLLALASIPGALVPQRSLNAQKVDQYIADNPVIGPLFDTLQMYEVFGSSWFTAIYVLLFISLIGCITPRVAEHFRALRTPPVRAPRRLARLPHHAAATLPGSAQENADKVEEALRGWRKTTRTEADGTITISAEKGYLREAGNLVFHIALVGVLLTVALGKIFGYEGNVIVIADGKSGICNTSPSGYDTFRAGLSEDGTGLHPFCVDVLDFKADYLPNGQAEMFTSNIRYQAAEDLNTDTWHDYRLRVNEPLRVDGARVYLQGHAFAPTFTVTFPDGTSRTKTQPFAPEEVLTFLSSGAVLFDPPAEMGLSREDSRKSQIALEGLFAPTSQLGGETGKLLTSSWPQMLDPMVAIDIYKGDSGLDSGVAMSVFRLNPQPIAQGRLVKQERVNLSVGESVTLEDGTIVRFDGAEEFANLQVSYDPAQFWVLVSAVTMMAGMLISLVIKRRRIWARITPVAIAGGPPGESGDGFEVAERRAVVELGGLARTDHAGWGEEFKRLGKQLLAEEPREEQRPPQA